MQSLHLERSAGAVLVVTGRLCMCSRGTQRPILANTAPFSKAIALSRMKTMAGEDAVSALPRLFMPPDPRKSLVRILLPLKVRRRPKWVSRIRQGRARTGRSAGSRRRGQSCAGACTASPLAWGHALPGSTLPTRCRWCATRWAAGWCRRPSTWGKL
jgi:hypothetical protein